MRMISWLTGGALVAAASAAGAQSTPAHEQHQAAAQHQAAGQHQGAGGGEKCCCEEMMRDMRAMMQMTKQHQGTGMAMPKDAPQPDKEHPH